MKKWIMSIVVGVLMASSASAAWWSFGSDQKTEEQPAVERPQRNRQGGQQRRPQMSEEQREKMKEHRETIQKLVEAARSEVDEVKKSELVEQLRTKLTEGAERMQAEFRKRLEQAEKKMEQMKERLADAEKNKEQKIEEHLQKLLSGEVPDEIPGRPRNRKRLWKKDPPPTAE